MLCRIRKRPTSGLILWSGPSVLDGRPIVLIATGLDGRSANSKTGTAVATYILSAEEDPIAHAKRSGAASVCGNCPQGPVQQADGTYKLGSCYVNIATAPAQVYKRFQRGGYRRFNPIRHARLFRGRVLRIGSYGDPAAVPFDVWQRFASLASRHVGYTHQWRTCDQRFRTLCMASVETAAQGEQARAMGWRTFRARLASQPLEKGEIVCPASAEAGKRKTCVECRACSGALPGGRNASVAIVFHSSTVAGNWKLRRYEAVMAEAERRPLLSLLMA